MKSVSNTKILIAIIVTSLLLVPLALFTEGWLRIIIGTIFLIFFPGYALISALFPKQADLGTVERIALSFGTSIAVVPLIGLILNYMPWGIRLVPILISVSLFIVIVSTIGCLRLAAMPANQRLNLSVPTRPFNWQALNTTDRIVTGVLVAVVLITLGSLIYVIAVPRQGETFSEFYILGPEGQAQDYPSQVHPGESIELIVGVVNHEQETTSYRVKIFLNGMEQNEISLGTLADGQSVQQTINVLPDMTGEDQKIELALYKNDEQSACFDNPLYIYIDVIETASYHSKGVIIIARTADHDMSSIVVK